MLLKNDASSAQAIQYWVFAVTECSEKEIFMHNLLKHFGRYNSIIQA